MAHILFVEDLPPQVDNIISTLRDEGHTVTLSKNIEAGNNILNSQLVDLLVLDIHGIPPSSAPEPNLEKLVYGGLTLYEKARERFPRLKIIIFSIFNAEEIKTEAAFRGIRLTRCLFRKKGDYMGIMSAIREALGVDDDTSWPRGI